MKARKHDFWLFLINVAVFVSVSEAQFNLFMNESETHRLLGKWSFPVTVRPVILQNSKKLGKEG